MPLRDTAFHATGRLALQLSRVANKVDRLDERTGCRFDALDKLYHRIMYRHGRLIGLMNRLDRR